MRLVGLVLIVLALTHCKSKPEKQFPQCQAPDAKILKINQCEKDLDCHYMPTTCSFITVNKAHVDSTRELCMSPDLLCEKLETPPHNPPKCIEGRCKPAEKGFTIDI